MSPCNPLADHMQTKNNHTIAIAMMAAGFLLIVLAWNGAASFDTIQQQFPYLLSGGLAGLGLIGGGLGLIVVREQRRTTAVLEAKLDEIVSALTGGQAAGDTPTTTLVANGHLTERQRRALERAGAN